METALNALSDQFMKSNVLAKYIFGSIAVLTTYKWLSFILLQVFNLIIRLQVIRATLRIRINRKAMAVIKRHNVSNKHGRGKNE